jgi:hypothetical protein
MPLEDLAMADLPNSAAGDMYAETRNLRWSPVEKVIARKAFNLALQQELESIIREAKERAARMQKPFELWDLEQYLTQRRNEIDRKYDSRYSMIPFVLGALLQESRISEDHLRGLREDKLGYIRELARGKGRTKTA